MRSKYRVVNTQMTEQDFLHFTIVPRFSEYHSPQLFEHIFRSA